MSARYRFTDFELRLPSRELLRDGQAVAIEPKVFDVLSYLVTHRGRAVGRDELIAAVWGRVDVADATLQQAISRLRRALGESEAVSFVRTVPRHGYQWVAPTRSIDDSTAPEPAVETALADTVVQAGLPVAPPPGQAVNAESAEVTAAVPARPTKHLAAALLVALVLAALVLVARWWYAQAPTGEANPLAQAAQLARQGQFAQAHALLQPLAASKPQDTDLQVDLAAIECALEQVQSCLARLDAALRTEHLSPRAQTVAHLEIANRRLRELRTDDAAAATELASAAAGDGADAMLQARLLHMRHRIATARGDDTQALEMGQRALALYRTDGNSVGHAELLYSLGAVAGRHGELDRSLSWLEQSAALYRANADSAGLARTLSALAYGLSQVGRFAEALTAAREALQQAQAQSSPSPLREALTGLAWASIQTGHLADAREAVHRALALPGVVDNPQQEVSLRSLLGFVDAAGGRYNDALAAWNQALLRLPAGVGEKSTAGLRLAVLYAALQDGNRRRADDEASSLTDAAHAQPALQQYADHAHALLAAADNDTDHAAQLFSQVWAQARRSGSLNQQMLADYADVLLQRNDLATLETLLGEPSLPAREGHLYQLVQARYLARRGQAAKARLAFDRARELAGERYTRWLDVTRNEIAALPERP